MFDLAPFAFLARWNNGQGATLETQRVRFADGAVALAGTPPHLGLEWEEPRNIRRIVAEFEGEPPDPSEARIEYWHNHWPQPDPEARTGTHRGWIGQDDPFHGEWVTARGDVARDGNTLIFTFDPLDGIELPQVQDLEKRPAYLAPYRRALKIRLALKTRTGVEPSQVYGVVALRAYSDAMEVPFAVNVRLLERAEHWHPTVSAYNGYVDAVSAPGAGNPALCVTGRGTNASADLRESRADSHDCTLLTFRGDGPEFTINLADLAQGSLWIKDLGVYVTGAGNDIPFEQYKAQCEAAPRQPIYERVAGMPEQTYERAKAEIPALDIAAHPPYGRYVVLGIVNGQQKFGLRYNGEVFVGKGLLKLNNRMAARLRWPGRDLHWRIGTGDPPDFRERNGANRQWLEEGTLPIVHTGWQDRDIAYEQTAFAVGLGEVPGTFAAQRGDEDVVLMMTLTARNTTTSPRRACIWLQPSPDEALTVDEQGRVLAHGYLASAQYSPAMTRLVPYDQPVLRAQVVPSCLQGERADNAACSVRGVSLATSQSGNTSPNAVLCEIALRPGESATLDLRIPFSSFCSEADWQRVAALDWTQARTATADFWRPYTTGQALIHLPAGERDIEDFTRAVPWHILVSAMRDPLTGHLVVPPGTFWYMSCGNEAAWQTTGLDLLGYHEHARAYLDSMLAVQGRVLPDGDFKSAEGALQSMDFDQGEIKRSHFSYNLDHGTILEGIIHHYRITGDQDWLRRIAPQVVAACDFVTRERVVPPLDKGGTPTVPHLGKGETPAVPPLNKGGLGGVNARTRGLMPPGHLEDNPEWRYWFAVNAHACGGMCASAAALAEIDHPEAGRIRADAAAYRQDIQNAVREARILSPVVRLLNGVAVPHVPARAELRWREWGWIREAAYGAIHLWDGGVWDDHAPEVTWVLQDLEDNLFVNREYGFGINLDDDWFSQGGVTSQPNLMSIDLTYLRRDQVGHSLRNFYNNVAYGLYPDVRCLAEWMSEPGLGGGPFFKPSDEARVVTWLRHHLVTEERMTSPNPSLVRRGERRGASPYQGEAGWGSEATTPNPSLPRRGEGVNAAGPTLTGVGGEMTSPNPSLVRRGEGVNAAGSTLAGRGEEVLWLAKGAPRAWHVDGRAYGIDHAPTFFGHVTYRVESHLARKGEIRAHVELDLRRLPAGLKLRLRHPDGKPFMQVLVNEEGTATNGEDILLPLADGMLKQQFDVVARYG